MTGKAEASLSRLFTSAKSLNSVSDQITIQIKEIEAALAAHGIGVTGWAAVESWDEQTKEGYTLHYSTSIGYGKLNGKWGLLYDLYCDEFGESSTSFLRDSAREVRIAALEKLPDLFDKLAEATAELTERANKNLVAAKAIASALKENGRK